MPRRDEVFFGKTITEKTARDLETGDDILVVTGGLITLACIDFTKKPEEFSNISGMGPMGIYCHNGKVFSVSPRERIAVVEWEPRR